MNREYPNGPVVAVGVIIRDGEQIALIRRSKEPSRGLWTFPGGAVELGETLQDDARREALEETGLHVQVEDIAAVVENVVQDDHGHIRYHDVILDFSAHPIGGSLNAATDANAACWVSLADLDSLEMTEKAEQLARKLLSDASPT